MEMAVFDDETTEMATINPQIRDSSALLSSSDERVGKP